MILKMPCLMVIFIKKIHLNLIMLKEVNTEKVPIHRKTYLKSLVLGKEELLEIFGNEKRRLIVLTLPRLKPCLKKFVIELGY